MTTRAVRSVAPLAAASVLVAAGCTSEPAVERPADPAPDRLLAMPWGPRTTWAYRAGRLARLDPRSLEVTGTPVPLRRFVSFGWSFSPDQTRLVLGGFRPVLRFVDPRLVRRLGDLELGGRGSVIATAWPTPRKVLAAVQQRPGTLRLVLVDPVVRRVLARRPLAPRNEVIDSASSPYGLALLLAPPGSVGAARLVVARADGSVGSARIDAVAAGVEPRAVPAGSPPVDRRWLPGLAVDASGRRAFVVGGGAPVAEVDLATMRVAYHRLAERVSLLGRLRKWLEPRAFAKGESEGPVRTARWLGDGLLAVSGWDARGAEAPVAAGLRLVDTRTWSVRTLDRETGRVTLAGPILVAHGCCLAGLRAYDRDGTRRWHRFGRERIHDVEASGERVFVYRYFPRGRARILVLDLHTGATLRSVETPWFQLIRREAAPWPR
jgi:hypothetical protein